MIDNNGRLKCDNCGHTQIQEVHLGDEGYIVWYCPKCKVHQRVNANQPVSAYHLARLDNPLKV